jgi:hypothetical protein
MSSFMPLLSLTVYSTRSSSVGIYLIIRQAQGLKLIFPIPINLFLFFISALTMHQTSSTSHYAGGIYFYIVFLDSWIQGRGSEDWMFVSFYVYLATKVLSCRNWILKRRKVWWMKSLMSMIRIVHSIDFLGLIEPIPTPCLNTTISFRMPTFLEGLVEYGVFEDSPNASWWATIEFATDNVRLASDL